MLLILKPDPTDKTPNHFVVFCDGVQVGRIFDRVPRASAPREATWCWTINGRYRRDCGLGVGGDAATREDAIAAFRKPYARAFSGSGGMFGNFGKRHPNLEFALIVLCGVVVGGFGLGAINYAMLEIATKQAWLRQGATMWSVVFIATVLFAITFAVVSYSMREVHKRGKAGWPR